MLKYISEHLSLNDPPQNPEDKELEKALEKERERHNLLDFQQVAVLSMSLIATGEDIGNQMVIR